MSIICPTVTAFDLHSYREQLDKLVPFAKRIHIDLMDGVFAPTVSPDLDKIWLPEGIICDIHIMYQHPEKQLKKLIALKPHMVIIHAESQCNVEAFVTELKKHDIKTGMALLQETSVSGAKDKIAACDHCLIFSGHLGYHGGVADLGQLKKVAEIRENTPKIEISWDGGINKKNITELSDGGIDVLNTGGAITEQENPHQAYDDLIKTLEK